MELLTDAFQISDLYWLCITINMLLLGHFCMYACRPPTEASGLPHVEPAREEKTGTQVHGGAECDRRRITSASEESHRHDAAWTEVWQNTSTHVFYYNLLTLIAHTDVWFIPPVKSPSECPVLAHLTSLFSFPPLCGRFSILPYLSFTSSCPFSWPHAVGYKPLISY